MFNIGFGELILILFIALIVVGPKDLPKVARSVGKGVKKIKLISQELREAINIEDDINEVKEIKKSIDDEISDINPISDLKKDVNEISKAVKAVKKDVKK